MIKRYATEEMTRIWSDQNKFNTWRRKKYKINK